MQHPLHEPLLANQNTEFVSTNMTASAWFENLIAGKLRCVIYNHVQKLLTQQHNLISPLSLNGNVVDVT
jgi:hypothetical protein